MISLRVSGQFFSHLEAKPKLIAPCTRDFSRALNRLDLIARLSDWFTTLFTPVVIGRSNYFGYGFFRQSFENLSIAFPDSLLSSVLIHI